MSPDHSLANLFALLARLRFTNQFFNDSWMVGLRQHRFDGAPFIIAEFVAHDSMLPVWELESRPYRQSRHFPGSQQLARFPVVNGVKRKSAGRENRLNRSKMTHLGNSTAGRHGRDSNVKIDCQTDESIDDRRSFTYAQ